MYLDKRQFGYPYGNSNGYYNNGSAFSNWGRWVVTGVVIFAVLAIFFLFSCITARRRRRAGATPYKGTGWLAGTPAGHGPAQYYGPAGSNTQPYYGNQTQPEQQAAPPYTADGANASYYGQQNGIEMQQPANTYQPQRGGNGVYAPPQGPPPTKERDIIR